MSREEFPVWCELVCGHCSHVGFGTWFMGRMHKSLMRDEALKGRWVFEHKEIFCSQACADKYVAAHIPAAEKGAVK